MSSTSISQVHGRRVFDSRGRPTVEAEVILADGSRGRAIAPAGASTGSGEAVDRRDGGDRFGGYDVTQAIVGVAEEWVQRRGGDVPAPVSPSLEVNAPSPLPDLRITPSQ